MQKTPQQKDLRLLVLAGSLLSGFALLTTFLSRGIPFPVLPASWQAGFAYEVDNSAMPTVSWLVLSTLATGFLIGIIAGKKRWDVRSPGIIILGFALLLRVISACGEPIHESDFYRYLWDGRSAAAGVNPYQFEPGALLIYDGTIGEDEPLPANGVPWVVREFSDADTVQLEKLDTLRDSDPVSYARVSHPTVPTVYPPAAQTLFLLVAGVFGESLAGLQAILIGLDLYVIFLILNLLGRFRLPKVAAILYAWHPLVVKEFANSAHYDVLAILCGMLALWGALRFRNAAGKAIWMGTWLGLGILAKYFILLLLPVLVFYLTENRCSFRQRIQEILRNRHVWLTVLTTAAVVFLGFLPYAIWNDVGWARLFEGLRTYRDFWQYNPGVFSGVEVALRSLGDSRSFSHARTICLVLLAGAVLVISFRPLRGKSEGAVRCFQILAALFVLSQTAFPWYLCWALAFLPFRPRFSWAWLSLAWPWNYLDFQPDSVASLEWCGFYVLSSAIWLSFLLVWIAEHLSGKMSLRPFGNSQML